MTLFGPDAHAAGRTAAAYRHDGGNGLLCFMLNIQMRTRQKAQ